MNFKIRRHKANPKISIQSLSDASGIPPSTICRIETGVVKNPGFLTVATIDAALTRLETERIAENENPTPEAA